METKKQELDASSTKSNDANMVTNCTIEKLDSKIKVNQCKDSIVDTYIRP